MAVTVVAAYDVSEDGRRARLAALLQTFGDRVQRSVFVLTVADEDLAAVRDRARQIIDLDTDSLYIFRQCEPCWDALTCIGQADPPDEVMYRTVW